jgi:hypothetical protein
MPEFIYNGQTIYLTNRQCLSLELILNISDEYREFIRLGDKLYDAFVERVEYHNVTINEFNWLKNNFSFVR